MAEALLFPVALILEFCGLFAVWNWSRRRRSIWWVLLGFVVVLVVTSPVIMFADDLPKRAYAGFFGMYLFAALAWAWWFEDLNPVDWKVGEVTEAIFAVILFAIANSGDDCRAAPSSSASPIASHAH